MSAFQRVVGAVSAGSLIGGISYFLFSKKYQQNLDESPPTGDTVSLALNAAEKLISTARFAVFITIDQQGFPHARVIDPLPPCKKFDEIWIGTNRYTRKVSHLLGNPRSSLIYFDSSSLGFAYISGLGSLVDDPQVKADKFASGWWLFYPEGPSGPRFLLIRFVPTRIEIISPLHKLASGLNSWRPITLLRESSSNSGWGVEPAPTESFLSKQRNGLDEDGK